MRIAVSRERCKGHGQCELFAPDVFEVDDEALVVLKTPEVTGSGEKDVREALLHCPEAAIFEEPA
ncbi:MAG TPA: ferredoxin [Trebonia sp.]|jgi:ferredoxin